MRCSIIAARRTFASRVDAVQPRRSTACWGWGLAQDRRSLGCVLLTDGSRRSCRDSFRSVSSPLHIPRLTEEVYSLSRHWFTNTAIHSKPRPGLASGWAPLPAYLGFCCLCYSVADHTDFVSLLRLSLKSQVQCAVIALEVFLVLLSRSC